MKEIAINVDKLVQLITKYTVTISFNGFTPFTQKVVNARKLFDELHSIADCDKETFIDFVNTCNNPKTWEDRKKYKRNDMIDVLFNNVEFQGKFKMTGCEAIGSDPYISHLKIKKTIPI